MIDAIKAVLGEDLLVAAGVDWKSYARLVGERPMSTKVMREHKAAATTAGILYITGTVAGVLSVVLIAPVRDAGDPLAAAAGFGASASTVKIASG